MKYILSSSKECLVKVPKCDRIRNHSAIQHRHPECPGRPRGPKRMRAACPREPHDPSQQTRSFTAANLCSKRCKGGTWVGCGWDLDESQNHYLLRIRLENDQPHSDGAGDSGSINDSSMTEGTSKVYWIGPPLHPGPRQRCSRWQRASGYPLSLNGQHPATSSAGVALTLTAPVTTEWTRTCHRCWARQTRFSRERVRRRREPNGSGRPSNALQGGEDMRG